MFDPQVPKQIQMLLLGLLTNADMPTDLADYTDPHPDTLTNPLTDHLINPDHDRYADPPNHYPDALTNPDMTRDLNPRLSYSLHPA